MKQFTVLVLAFVGCTVHSASTTKSNIGPQSLCTVLSDRVRFDGKEVLIESVYQQTPHGMVLFSESCESSFTQLEWREDDYASNHVLQRKGELLRENPYRRLSVIVRGILRIAHTHECFGASCLRQKVEGLELLRVEAAELP
jgi:hypothetical protein